MEIRVQLDDAVADRLLVIAQREGLTPEDIVTQLLDDYEKQRTNRSRRLLAALLDDDAKAVKRLGGIDLKASPRRRWT
jgi:hypothetical protein